MVTHEQRVDATMRPPYYQTFNLISYVINTDQVLMQVHLYMGFEIATLTEAPSTNESIVGHVKYVREKIFSGTLLIGTINSCY